MANTTRNLHIFECIREWLSRGHLYFLRSFVSFSLRFRFFECAVLSGVCECFGEWMCWHCHLLCPPFHSEFNRQWQHQQSNHHIFDSASWSMFVHSMQRIHCLVNIDYTVINFKYAHTFFFFSSPSVSDFGRIARICVCWLVVSWSVLSVYFSYIIFN